MLSHATGTDVPTSSAVQVRLSSPFLQQKAPAQKAAQIPPVVQPVPSVAVVPDGTAAPMANVSLAQQHRKVTDSKPCESVDLTVESDTEVS